MPDGNGVDGQRLPNQFYCVEENKVFTLFHSFTTLLFPLFVCEEGGIEPTRKSLGMITLLLFPTSGGSGGMK